MTKVGRPTEYSQAILDLARMYLDNLPEDEVVHSIEGLADYICINRDTIYNWASQEDKKAFSDIVEEVRHKQANTRINKGLTGAFTSPIAKVMLSKHGYREGIENMGKDGKDLIPDKIIEDKIDSVLNSFLANGTNTRDIT